MFIAQICGQIAGHVQLKNGVSENHVDGYSRKCNMMQAEDNNANLV